MRVVDLRSWDLSNFFALIEQQPGGLRHLFRGQRDAEWHLTPSLYRVENPPIGARNRQEVYDYLETFSINRFFDQGLPYLPPIQRSYANDRILAQHFGVATRLLDWTRDPLVALFFAVEGERDGVDAALFMIMPEAIVPPTEGGVPPGPYNVVAFSPPVIDRRIASQKSIFTYHPYGDPEQDFVPLDLREDIGNRVTVGHTDTVRGFVKINIEARFKGEIYSNLLRMGVDRRNLFPGLDGVGSDVAARGSRGYLVD